MKILIIIISTLLSIPALAGDDCFDKANSFSFFTISDSYPKYKSGIKNILLDVFDREKYPDRILPRFSFIAGDFPYFEDRGNGPPLFESNPSLFSMVSGDNYPFSCSASNKQFPYFVALGNHDIDRGKGYSDKKLSYWKNVHGKKVRKTLIGISNFKWGPSNRIDQRTNYSFDYKNSHFIVINQYTGADYSIRNPLGCIRPKLMKWLIKDLKRNKDRLIFVFGHEGAWPYCSKYSDGSNNDVQPGYNCSEQDPDYQDPPRMANWSKPYGHHWKDSLSDERCPKGSRDEFWNLLTEYNTISHFVGHSHAYSSRLVGKDGSHNKELSGYKKKGDIVPISKGTWEVDSGMITDEEAIYILTTVRDDTVIFESYAYDSDDGKEFSLIESWKVDYSN